MWRLLQCFLYVSLGQLHSKHFLIVDKFDNIITDVNMKGIPYILAYKSLSRISRTLKIESVCGSKSLTRV